MTPISTRKTQLETRLAELNARMETIETELESHSDPDLEEQATEREDDEVLESIGVSAQQESRMIAGALARIAEGDYGTCTVCGQTISDARLDLLPYTPFCKTCAADRQEARK